MYINYDHGSHKLWKFWFLAKFRKKNGCQSPILDPIRLKVCTLIHSMIVYKFSIHYVYKLWSWVTQMMKVLIFGQIQQKNGRQLAILDLICLKFYTLKHSIIVYKFPIHYVYKLWSWVTQMMKVLIFEFRIQKLIMREKNTSDMLSGILWRKNVSILGTFCWLAW